MKKRKSEDPPTLKTVLELLRSVQVALVGVDLAIADYRGEGGVSITEAPPILDDPEFFKAPDDSSSE